jgi:hypothetical protein
MRSAAITDLFATNEKVFIPYQSKTTGSLLIPKEQTGLCLGAYPTDLPETCDREPELLEDAERRDDEEEGAKSWSDIATVRNRKQ